MYQHFLKYQHFFTLVILVIISDKYKKAIIEMHNFRHASNTAQMRTETPHIHTHTQITS